MSNSLTEVQVSTISENSPLNDPEVKPIWNKALDNLTERTMMLVEIDRINKQYDDYDRKHPVAKNRFQKALSMLHIHYSEFK